MTYDAGLAAWLFGALALVLIVSALQNPIVFASLVVAAAILVAYRSARRVERQDSCPPPCRRKGD